MGPAFFIYKIFILLNHMKFYGGKFYRVKFQTPIPLIQHHIRIVATHCVSTIHARGPGIPYPIIPFDRLPKIPDSARASMSRFRRATLPKT